MRRYMMCLVAALATFAAILLFGIMFRLAEIVLADGQTLTCVVSESQYVNVRKNPRSDAATWGRLHNGDTIELEGVSGGWIEFSFGGRKAYANAKYFEITENGLYRINANGRVRVRSAPNGQRVDWADPGEIVSVEGWRYGEDDALWARCGGRYIAADYLVRVDGEAK